MLWRARWQNLFWSSAQKSLLSLVALQEVWLGFLRREDRTCISKSQNAGWSLHPSVAEQRKKSSLAPEYITTGASSDRTRLIWQPAIWRPRYGYLIDDIGMEMPQVRSLDGNYLGQTEDGSPLGCTMRLTDRYVSQAPLRSLWRSNKITTTNKEFTIEKISQILCESRRMLLGRIRCFLWEIMWKSHEKVAL